MVHRKNSWVDSSATKYFSLLVLDPDRVDFDPGFVHINFIFVYASFSTLDSLV